MPSLAALIDGLLAILDAEQVGRVHVWGTSFGGMAAQALVRRAPERVASLVLSNTAAPSERRTQRAELQLRLVAALPEWLVRRLLRASVGRQLRGLDRAQRRFWAGYLRRHLLTDAKAVTLTLSRIAVDFYRCPYRASDLDGWPGSVLLLEAEDDELYREMHEPLRRLYPRAEVRTFPGGHAASLGRQDQYLLAIQDQLRGPASPPPE